MQRQARSARTVAALKAKLSKADAREESIRRAHAEALEVTRQRLVESRERSDRLLAATEHLVRPEDDSDLDYVFIVTYGRSGSTLLQAVINTIPGFTIRGENRHAMRHLHAFHRDLAKEAGAHVGSAFSRRSPWWGIDQYAQASALPLMRRLFVESVLRPDPDTRVTGFKEIRWWDPEWEAQLAFVRQVFPGARFVFNTRNHDDVAKSKWWPKDRDPHGTLGRMERQMDAMVVQLGPDHAYRVHYDDWVADPERLRPLFAWLGEPYDAAGIRTVMRQRYSY